MSGVCVKGDTLSTGHGCTATTTLDTPSQSKITIGGILVATVGTKTVSHPFPPNPPCAPHIAQVNEGSAKVTIGGIPIARISDSADAGSMTTGSDGASGVSGKTVECGGPSAAVAQTLNITVDANGVSSPTSSTPI